MEGSTTRSAPDLLGRRLNDLRISVTDRCNFRCPYCMPREVFGAQHPFLPRHEILTYEEIVRLAACFVELGVRKVRVTGGEPLLRRDLPILVRRLAALPIEDLALTSNGSLLAERAEELAEAGLQRVSVSLDSLDDAIFRAMNDAAFPVARVLAGISAAERAGLRPIKINAVVRRGVNEQSIVPLVEHFRGSGHVVRFIEFMDVGTSNRWRLDDVVPVSEIIDRIAERFPLTRLESDDRAEVARRWRLTDGSLEIGLISSVSEPFCGECTRARLSADGRLFTCLFASVGHDLRDTLRSGADDAQLRARIEAVWSRREDRYSELRAADDGRDRAEMSYLGG